MYNPQPIDTSDIKLSEDMLTLTENLSKNTLDVCAKGRITEEWTFGKSRNDELKETLCLLSYEELSNVENNTTATLYLKKKNSII